MRLPSSSFHPLFLALFLTSCTHSTAQRKLATDGEPPAALFDLRKSFHQFSDKFRDKLWKLEDQALKDERVYLDDQILNFRTALRAQSDRALKEDEWKKARREFRDKRRELIAEFKQRIRIHKSQADLELMQLEKTLSNELKEFGEEIEEDLEIYKKESFFSKVQSDFREAKEEVKEELRKWKERMRDLRGKDAPVD